MSYLSSNLLSQLIIEPTGYCNANCPHCPRYDDNGNLHDYISLTHLKVEALENGLDKSLLTNLKNVYIAGATGDPAISPYITDIIDFFDFVPKIVMDTNGSLKNTTWWENLAKYKNLVVEWSIDGLEDTNHLYRIGTDWNKIIENATAYINSGGQAIWKCLIFKHNEHQIEQIKTIAKEMGFVGVLFFRADEYRFKDKKVWPVKVNGKHLYNIEQSDFKSGIIKSKSTMKDFGDNLSPPITDIKCPEMKRRSAYINVLGELFPCCMMTHETTNDYFGKDEFCRIVKGDFNNISLYKNKIDDIFKNIYGDYFNSMLTSIHTMHTVCFNSCRQIANDAKT